MSESSLPLASRGPLRPVAVTGLALVAACYAALLSFRIAGVDLDLAWSANASRMLAAAAGGAAFGLSSSLRSLSSSASPLRFEAQFFGAACGLALGVAVGLRFFSSLALGIVLGLALGLALLWLIRMSSGNWKVSNYAWGLALGSRSRRRR